MLFTFSAQLPSQWSGAGSITLYSVDQYGNARAVPSMLLPVSDGGISPQGTFWFFAAVNGVGWGVSVVCCA